MALLVRGNDIRYALYSRASSIFRVARERVGEFVYPCRCKDEDRGSAPIRDKASRSDGPSAAPPPSGGGRLEVSGPRHMESCGRRLPSLELSVGFWPPNWGPGDRLGVLLGTVDLNIPDIAVSSGDRNNQGKRLEVTLPL